MRALARVLALLGLPAVLAGQHPADTVVLAPVVVTATRVPTRADAVPAAVTVITGAELESQGIRTVADALRAVPAATVVETDAYGSVTSLFLRGGESDYTKVLIDGVAQNAPGGAYDFANLTTDDVERIEVVRGPVSVLYGSDAVTGVVQIFTRDGGGSGHGSAAVSGGTYGTSAVDASLAGGGDRAGYAVSVSRLASDGVYAFNNQYRNEVVSGRVRFRPDERSHAAISLRYSDAAYHFPTDGNGDPVSQKQRQLDRGPSVGLDLGHVFSPHVEGLLTAAWHRDNYQYANAPNDSRDTLNFLFTSSDWVTREGVEARANLRLPPADVLTVGTAFEREVMEGTTLATPQARNDGAVYGQLVTGLERPVSLTAGARLEDNQRFGRYATYRAGISLRLAARTRAIASVGTGFKEPSFYQNFATGLFAHGNPDLKPEHSFSWEAGLESSIPDSPITTRATYFDQRFRDLIDFNAGDNTYLNVPGADARGVEVTSDAALGAAVHVTAGYTWLHTRVTQGGASTAATALFVSGQRLLRRPEHAGTVGLAYRSAGRVSATVTARYTGNRDDLDYATLQRVTLPAYTRVDAALQYDMRRANASRSGLTLTARVENLLDRAYEEVKNVPARRRTLLFGGQVRFGT
jgi:vitamin B12 transporter